MSRGLRAALTFALVVALTPLTCTLQHNLRHPAPLVRSETAILRRVDATLPIGTPLDSVRRVFAAPPFSADLLSAEEAASRMSRDSLRANGPVLIVIQPSTTRNVFVYDADLYLYFNPDHRLVRRRVDFTAVEPM